MTALSDAAKAALATHELLIGYAVEWLGPEHQEGVRCQHCGSPADPEHGNPLAHLYLYNFPVTQEALKMALHDTLVGEDTQTKAWYHQTMERQLRGDFNVTEQRHDCWACIGTLLLSLLEDMLAVKMTLAVATNSTREGLTPLARPLTSLLFMGGEREEGDWGYSMAHIGKRLADINLLDMLNEGLVRAATDTYNLSLE